MKRTRVNIRTVCNTKAVRHETRNGRAVIVVPSATLPDNVVMNGRLYPADEIAKTYMGLSDTPAPLGHPKVNGKHVSAFHPEGLNVGYIGAWNANVRRENGRVLLDKVIDVEVASRSEGGKAVLAAIEKGEPIHTSTGLYCNLEETTEGGDKYKFIARNMVWDHDAILLDEEGAATPEQGVGMFVNAAGEQEEIEVVNSVLAEADRDLDWAMQSLASAIEKRHRAGFLDQLKSLLLDLWPTAKTERETTLNQKEEDMAVSEEQFNALSAKVDTLSESIATAVTNAVNAAVKPLTEAHAEIVANQKAKDDAEHADLVGKVVKANLLSEVNAKASPLATLRELAKIADPKAAAAIAGGDPMVNGKDEFEGYDMNAALEVK